MDQRTSLIGSFSVSGASAPSLQACSLQIKDKGTLKGLIVQIAGTYDQSGGAESQATEGNPVLFNELRLRLDGNTRRSFKGGVVYELNKMSSQGAGTAQKTDPATGNNTGKAFSSLLFYDMGLFDIESAHVHDETFLDLTKIVNAWVEFDINPFTAYVSGNTQANIAYTVTVSGIFIQGLDRTPQKHAEAQLITVQDMSATLTGKIISANPAGQLWRGFLVRCGTLAATPKVTATTAISKLGCKATLKDGGPRTLYDKAAPSFYQSFVGANRAGVQLTAGYLFVDLVNNRKAAGVLIGNNYADLSLDVDITGTSGTTMEVYGLVSQR